MLSLIKKLRPLTYSLFFSFLPLMAAWDGQPPEYTPAEEEKESAYAVENYALLSQKEKNQRLFDAAAGDCNRQTLIMIDAQALFFGLLPSLAAKPYSQHIVKKNTHIYPGQHHIQSLL